MKSQDELMQVVVGMLTAAVEYKRTGDQSLMLSALDEGLTYDEACGIVGLLLGTLLNTVEAVGLDPHEYVRTIAMHVATNMSQEEN